MHSIKRSSIKILAAYLCSLCVTAGVAIAQTLPRSLLEGGTENSIKDRKNAWTIGIAGGLYEGTFMRLAVDMSRVLDDGDNIRIMPVVSHGAASNLEDLLYVRGIDAAVTQSDVFEFFRTQRNTPNLENRVQYILRFPLAEFHLLARPEIHSVEDLRNRKVHSGSEGAAGSLTGPIVFQRLGIPVQQVSGDNPTGMKMLRSGEIDAVVRVVAKPVDYVTQVPANSGLHLLSVNYFSRKFDDFYVLGEFTHADYPNVVPDGDVIDTIAVPGVLAVYNWPKGSDRERRVDRFVDRLFTNLEKFREPPYHPKWRDINPSAIVPGWTRYRTAQEMLNSTASADKETRQQFSTFLQQNHIDTKGRSDVTLYQEFLKWRQGMEPQQRR